LKILLLGAQGQLGECLFREHGTTGNARLIAATRDGKLPDGSPGEMADLTNRNQLEKLLDRTRPDIILNAAAYTAVDRAEQEEHLATIVNGEAVGWIGRWAAASGGMVMHFSTDYVFDGQGSAPYREDAPVHPLNAYGRSKWHGEQALRESGAEHMIFRTAWVYSAGGKNFLRTMLRLAKSQNDIRVVADQQGTPTSALLLARATMAAIAAWQHSPASEREALMGTYHLVAGGETTWCGFATAIMEGALRRGLLDQAPTVTPIASVDFPTPAARPAYSVMDNAGFQRRFGFSLPDWQLGLADTLDIIKQNGILD
jgi:dTDP-4-dehydrorhamnose reductase